MIQINTHDSHVDFLDTDTARVFARYNHRDAFKPHFHPLCTPQGHVLTLVSPNDHVHHKGLMYSLKSDLANFWEEHPFDAHETIGKQLHRSFESLTTPALVAGFVELLDWVTPDGRVLMTERRSIHVTREGPAYVWHWGTRLESKTNQRLIKSRWAMKKPDRTVNYHGLGLRMRRDFGGSGVAGNALYLDGAKVDAADWSDRTGSTPAEARFVGRFDGVWPPRHASATLRPPKGHGLFVRNLPWAFLSFGPTALEELDFPAGKVIEETYELVVKDE